MLKALYAGSFDPLTMGHLDIIRRASKLCDELVVGVITNPNKQPMFSSDERMDMIRSVTDDLSNVSVDTFSGLLADYVNRGGFGIVFRGLRGTTDFDSEIHMAQLNDRLYDDKVETVFLMTSPDYSFISSSMVKEVFKLNGSIEGLVPDRILSRMEELTEKKG